jgi:uncharacterized protein
MTALFPVGIGAVLSADIAAPDHERVRHFYARVLTTGAVPLWREADLLNSRGMPIIGIGARTEAYEALPVQWMPHIQVDDVRTSVERAVARGGQVLMESRDAEGTSQWAVLQDPQGAAFGVVPAADPDALAPTDADAAKGPTGRIAWLDITVPDADTLRDFYAHVIGWHVEPLAMQHGDERYADYVMRAVEGAAAGVCHARGPNAGLPPVWLIYLPVGDLTESLARVEAEGGRVLRSARQQDGTYVYAAIEDPAGACLALAPG